MSGVRKPIFFCQNSASSASRCGGSTARCAGVPASGCRYSARSTIAGRYHPTGGRRPPAPPARSPRCRPGARRSREDRQQQVSLSMSRQPGKADDFACAATSSLPSFSRAGRARTRSGQASGLAAATCAAAFWRAFPPRPSPSPAGRGRRHWRRRRQPPCRHASPRCVGIPQHLASTCEIRMQLLPPATKRRTKASNWPAVCASATMSARRG